MRLPLAAAALLLLGTAPLAFAVAPTTTNVLDLQGAIADKNASLSGNQPVEPVSQGGENIGSAVVIGSLPYYDTGFTCDNVDDYDEVCPFTGSTSPDVVYRYTPGSAIAVNVDLCSSSYDTKVYIYANAAGNLVACNDDASCGITGYQSLLTNVSLSAGVDYYIVVDGYFGDCGNYFLNINQHYGCTACPPSHQDEGEPACGPNYVDSFNGGCNSTPDVFSPVNCTDICGKTGTYLFNGSNYRDTDWYRVTFGPGRFLYSGFGDGFSLRIAVCTPICPTGILSTTSTPACVPSTSLVIPGPGTFDLMAAPEAFDGVPCESKYYLSITGPGIPMSCGTVGVPGPPVNIGAERTSWGAVKGLYR